MLQHVAARVCRWSGAALAVAAMLASPASAQAPRGGGAPAAPPFDPAAISQVSAADFREMMVDPGVFYATVMDRPEVRVGHTRLAPGGSRRTHTHDDVTWHLMVPVSGSVRMTVASDAPIDTTVGRVYFLKPHIPHSFINNGSTDAVMMELFVKPAPGAAAGGRPGGSIDAEALALAMAASAAAPR